MKPVRTNKSYRFNIEGAFLVEVHRQDAGNWLIDVETMKGKTPKVSFNEYFYMEEIVDGVIEEIEKM